MADEPVAALRKEVEAQRSGKTEEEKSPVAAALAATVIGVMLSVALFVMAVAATAFIAFTLKVCILVWNWIL